MLESNEGTGLATSEPSNLSIVVLPFEYQGKVGEYDYFADTLTADLTTDLSRIAGTFDFTNFNFYHKVGDEVDLMDFGHMSRLINNMIPVLEGFSNSPEREVKYY